MLPSLHWRFSPSFCLACPCLSPPAYGIALRCSTPFTAPVHWYSEEGKWCSPCCRQKRMNRTGCPEKHSLRDMAWRRHHSDCDISVQHSAGVRHAAVLGPSAYQADRASRDARCECFRGRHSGRGLLQPGVDQCHPAVGRLCRRIARIPASGPLEDAALNSRSTADCNRRSVCRRALTFLRPVFTHKPNVASSWETHG